jgi:nitrogen fixation protein FixH
MHSFLQRLWGADQGRAFKMGAWVVAITAFAGHHFLYEDKRPAEIRRKAEQRSKK